MLKKKKERVEQLTEITFESCISKTRRFCCATIVMLCLHQKTLNQSRLLILWSRLFLTDWAIVERFFVNISWNVILWSDIKQFPISLSIDEKTYEIANCIYKIDVNQVNVILCDEFICASWLLTDIHCVLFWILIVHLKRESSHRSARIMRCKNDRNVCSFQDIDSVNGCWISKLSQHDSDLVWELEITSSRASDLSTISCYSLLFGKCWKIIRRRIE